MVFFMFQAQSLEMPHLSSGECVFLKVCVNQWPLEPHNLVLNPSYPKHVCSFLQKYFFPLKFGNKIRYRRKKNHVKRSPNIYSDKSPMGLLKVNTSGEK